MRIRVSCWDGDGLWVIDDVIGGLYFIDQKKFETKCMIDCQKLFPHGKFEVLSLFPWKNDYIILVPREAHRNWILYNKVTGEIEYRKVIDRKCQEILIASDQSRGQLYFMPLFIRDPILIIDLHTLKCLQSIENWRKTEPDDCGETAWKGTYSGHYIFFPLHYTKTLVRMECENKKVELLELDVLENLIDVNYAFGELWVLPVRGNRIYQIDENGTIINDVELLMESAVDSLPCFARIIVQKRCLFLIPCYRKGIYIYDKWSGKISVVPEENHVPLRNNKELHLRYWEFYVRENRIWFLPIQDNYNYIEIDFDTLEYENKGLLYPNIWSDEEKIWRTVWSQFSERDSIIRETDYCNLKTFLKYVQQKMSEKDSSLTGYLGKGTWDMLKN